MTDLLAVTNGKSRNNEHISRLLYECAELFKELDALSLHDRIYVLNKLRQFLSTHSPFSKDPCDCVQWVNAELVEANDYNPNVVAPPEMKLLELSIEADGYTQPIVANKEENKYQVVDGFHRHIIGKKSRKIHKRVHGYLPIVQINSDRKDRNDRIASTIRHNRARGKHVVKAMSDIVVELKKRNWSDERIAKNLGMDQDEVLRLCQISGLSEMFSDREFSKSWDVEGEITEADFEDLTDDISSYGDDIEVRTVNTNDDNRIFHTHDKWECHKAGFYKNTVDGLTKKQCQEIYREFLSDPVRFEVGLARVISEWKYSCEHYLTNSSMNRIAWLGQAACCIETGIPSEFRGGFYLLSEQQQRAANELALTYLNKWLEANGRTAITLEEAYSYDRQSDIY